MPVESLVCNMLRFVILIVAMLALWAAPALAEKRVALVVGNGAYAHVSGLPNPTRDAADMAAALRGIGFSVSEMKDLGKPAFEQALADFSDVAAGADFAIIYYAGHGMEVGGRNYLIPVDAKLETDRRVHFETLSLDDVLQALEGVKGIRMVLLDACRNNPFAASMKITVASRAVGRGLSRVEAANGTVISFAAKEGSVASDGDGANSPFTAALLSQIAAPGLEIQFLMRRVRDRVMAATNNQQEPYISASLPGEAVYLVPPEPVAAEPPPAPPAPAEIPGLGEEEAFKLSQSIGTVEGWDAFLTQFPSGSYAPYAKAAREKLTIAALPKPTLEKAAKPEKKEATPKPSTKKKAVAETSPGAPRSKVAAAARAQEYCRNTEGATSKAINIFLRASNFTFQCQNERGNTYRSLPY